MKDDVNSVELKQHSDNSGVAARTAGVMLKQARNAAGLTQAEVARSLCLTVNVIAALERDDYNSLPGVSYVRGYLRAYANFLNQSPDLILESFEQHAGNAMSLPPIKSPAEFAKKENLEKDGVTHGMTYLLILGLIVLVFLWWHEHRSKGEKEIATAISESTNIPNVNKPVELAAKIQMPDPTKQGPGFGGTSTHNNGPNWLPQDPVVILKQPGESTGTN